MTEAIAFAITITVPNLLLMALGFHMRRRGQATDEFLHHASFLVFNYTLPATLFFSVLNSDVKVAEQLSVITAGFVVTFILFALGELYAKFFVPKVKDKGVFVQGVFRSNLGIVGLATVHNAYGEAGLGVGAVYLGVVTILFNVLGVITLSRSDSSVPTHKLTTTLATVGKKVVRNPLIISLVLAFLYKELHDSFALPMPADAIQKTGSLLSAVTLPLALICAGATLNIKSMLHPTGLSMQASIGRIFVAPLVAVAIGVAFGLTQNQVQMGVLFLMVSAPAATAGFVMAKAMGGNEELAANIMAFTAVFSMIGMGVGAGILRGLSWM